MGKLPDEPIFLLMNENLFLGDDSGQCLAINIL